MAAAGSFGSPLKQPVNIDAPSMTPMLTRRSAVGAAHADRKVMKGNRYRIGVVSFGAPGEPREDN